MKLEEYTEFLIEWGDEQRLTVHEGVAMAAEVLGAGPLPVQVGIRSVTYMALGTEVPEAWLALFEVAVDPAAIQAEMTFTSRTASGFLTQTMSLAPCEQGEHLHATVTLAQMILVDEAQTAATVQAAMYEAWRVVGDQMADLQDRWVHPFLEVALELESLHGGQG